MTDMSDADVRFHRLDGLPADVGEEQTFDFVCPRRGHRCEGLLIAGRTDIRRDGQNQNDGVAQWDWDGCNSAAPTFAPSIHCTRCGWHGYISTGRCKALNGSDEPEPDQRGP